MKKVGDIMKELGFNPQASEGTKRAFVKNLIQQQSPTEKITSSDSKTIEAESKLINQEQLSFNFDPQPEKSISPKKAG